jgi:phytoene dehydrogenase-like protein
MRKKVIVIGAGIAGLSAGSYAMMNGFDVEIMEQNQVGGLCTSKKIGDYTFDSGLSLLNALSPHSNANRIWRELSLVPNQQFIYPEELSSVYYNENSVFHAYSDPEKLKNEMLSISPDDLEIVSLWIEDLKVLSRIDMPLEFTWRYIPYYYAFSKLSEKYKMPAWKFAMQFKNTTLADVFSKAFDLHDQSLICSMMTLVSLHKKNAGYPIGGSNSIALALEKKYLDLGGVIRFDSKVSSILVQKNKAIGVKLSSGEEIKSDTLISCADGYTTLFEWLDKKYLTIRFKEAYKKLETYPPLVTVSLGIKKDYSYLPRRFTLSFPEGIALDLAKIDQLHVENRSFDKTLTSAGKSVMQIMIPTNYKIWELWSKNTDEYEKRKTMVLENCIKALGQKIPDLPLHVESTDLVTPIDYYLNTGNWQASYQGFIVKEKKQFYYLSQELPLLNRFYMAGHWSKIGGGVAQAAISGRTSIRKLCREFRVPFKN